MLAVSVDALVLATLGVMLDAGVCGDGSVLDILLLIYVAEASTRVWGLNSSIRFTVYRHSYSTNLYW